MTLTTYPEKSIRYLYEVGLHGGIRRAADVLGLNPSVVSRQLSLLERTLQMPLLERRGRNVVLTEAGRLLAGDYAITQQRRNQLERQLNDMRHMRGGSVTVRVGQGLVEEIIVHVVSEFSRIYPNVFLDITSGNMETSIELIAKGEVDMAVGFGPVGQPALKRYSYNRGPICAVVKHDHPIASYKTVTVQELAEHRLIAMGDNFGLQRYLTSMFRNEGLIFRPSYCCNLFASAIALSRAGLGIAFMTEQTVKTNLHQGELVAIPIDHHIAQESQWHVLRSSDHRFTPAAHYFWKLLCNFLSDTSKLKHQG
ncbi:LysR family transcriptional regulator [Pectobacterium sp. B1J-3]|uniref:LysR family transcriptional regulator n=1 Tax=Pectobacterium sp. B1J-3 TaxID=3385371 RepID=UPI0039061ECE